ncbi:naphthalene 1,2-dioxygenase, partial [Klebsiella pneumoniae]|nr:naphthalene 1,2-dioxygenase [Klebsiella pneumoniae]
MSWIGVCDAEQVQEDFPYSDNFDGKEIGIYLIDGEYYALEDVCPHA